MLITFCNVANVAPTAWYRVLRHLHLDYVVMPHCVQPGVHSLADLCVLQFPSRRQFPLGAYIIEVLDIIAGITFVVGSCCFLPRYAEDVKVFLTGCMLFIVGSVLYFLVCLFCFVEALIDKGRTMFEVWENAMYLIGCTIFFVGTILYLPDTEDKCKDFEKGTAQCKGLAQQVNIYDDEYLGSVLFGVGSVVFALAAYINAMGQRQYESWTHNMLSIITTNYLVASILFAMGSMSFMPNMGCDEHMLTIGAWLFIVGSVMFLVGAVLSMWRTSVIYAQVAVEDDPNEKLSNEKLAEARNARYLAETSHIPRQVSG